MIIADCMIRRDIRFLENEWLAGKIIHGKEHVIMPEKMKDVGKGGEDRVRKMKEEQQKEQDKSSTKEVHEYPPAEGDTKKDVPPGT